MNRTFAMAWLVGTVSLCAHASESALPVQVSGVTSLPGLKCACFAVRQPGAGVPPDFMLLEGETGYGIRLLKIEAVLNRVQIEIGGQTRYLHIRSTPDLSSLANAGGSAESETFTVIDENGRAHDQATPVGDLGATRVVDGNPIGLPVGTGSDGKAPAANVSRNSSAGNDPNPAETLKDQSNTDWYQQSLGIEQSRMADAQAVLSGEQSPWPRTPLTPAGTAPNLVGDDTLFPSHIPGFYR